MRLEFREVSAGGSNLEVVKILIAFKAVELYKIT